MQAHTHRWCHRESMAVLLFQELESAILNSIDGCAMRLPIRCFVLLYQLYSHLKNHLTWLIDDTMTIFPHSERATRSNSIDVSKKGASTFT
jgi:hypothetical protein